MPKYSYTAVDIYSNKKVSDTVDARDENDLRRILRTQNLVPVKYKSLEGQEKTGRVTANEASEFSRQLSSMLGSGITIVRAIEILMDRDFRPGIKLIYQKLHRDVQLGYTLSEAMRRQPKAFPDLMVNMYATGEASGQLEHVASKMAIHYEKEHRLNSQIRTAMLYPIFLFFITVAVVMIVFIVVLPKFFELFQDIEIPLITRVVIAISGFLEGNWYWVVIGLLVLITVAQSLLTIHPIALRFDRFKLRFRPVRGLLKTIYTARFARTLSSLYTSGISMITALEITSTIISNKYIESQFEEIIRQVRNGEPLSVAVGRVDGFEKKLATTILIGEESGRLDAMLESTAESFDYEAEVATGRLVQMLGPVMIIVIAVIICVIMLSVVLPIMTLYQNVGNY